MVTSSTRQSGRSDDSSRTTSRAAVLLPTATLPPSAIRYGTRCDSPRNVALGGRQGLRAASIRSASSRASGT